MYFLNCFVETGSRCVIQAAMQRLFTGKTIAQYTTELGLQHSFCLRLPNSREQKCLPKARIAKLGYLYILPQLYPH